MQIWDTNHTSHPCDKIRACDPIVKAKYTVSIGFFLFQKFSAPIAYYCLA